MKTAVCMCTYNGERYIEEQLRSIWQQTCPPEEVVIYDDGSGDATVDKVLDFIRTHEACGQWRLYTDEQNLGYPACFYHAMSLCEADIVFLADQDDVWHPQKLEIMGQILERHPDCKLVCCRFALMDAQGKEIRSLLGREQGAGSGSKAPFSGQQESFKTAETAVRPVSTEEIFYKSQRPGMVLAYRNDWYRQHQRENLTIPHDFYLSVLASQEHGYLQTDRVLAYHRRHENNAGREEHRAGKLLDKQRKLREIEDYLAILHAFAREEIVQGEEAQQILLRKTESMTGRYEALKSGKIYRVVKNALKYRKNMRLATVLCDIMIAGKK